MGHDDPKNPHHHHGSQHHDQDELISAPRGARPAPVATSDERAPAPAETPSAPIATLPQGAGRGKLLHLDCFSGIAGDMLVGALLDLGIPREPILAALDALPISGFSVGAAPRVVSSIAATKFLVRVDEDQAHRTWRDIRAMLDRASLDDAVRDRAQRAFRMLAIAEGRIHRIAPEDVHFHEVGAIDAIVDIVAASAGLEWLGAEVSCAPIPIGRGFVRAEHGLIPLPAPAVVELLAGVPTENTNLELELVTPTGAALVKANVTRFERWPAMRPIATGFGAGTRTMPDRPNLVRAILGDPAPATTEATATSAAPQGEFVVLEANLDDATGEQVGHATEALLRAGALDAWTIPIGMKKTRPGVMVCALVRAPDRERAARVLMSETTTLGVRVRPCERFERPRRMVHVETAYGRVPLKVADGDGLPENAKPEDDVVASLAERHGVPTRVVSAAALAAWWSRAR